MNSALSGRRLAAIAGVSAIIAMGAITAGCANEQKAPETTTTTTPPRRPPPRLQRPPRPVPHRPKRASTPPVVTCSLRQFHPGAGSPGGQHPGLPGPLGRSIAGVWEWLPSRRSTDVAHEGALPAAGDPRDGGARARHGHPGRAGVRRTGGDRGSAGVVTRQLNRSRAGTRRAARSSPLRCLTRVAQRR